MIDFCKTCVHSVDRADFCDNCYYCGMLNDRGIAPTGYEEAKKQTNADRIRSMSDEELALFLEEVHMKLAAFFKRCQRNCLGEDCYECYLEWLKQEAEDGE